MKMIIGGSFQGKENYARKMFPDICFINGKNAGKDDILKARGILGLQDFVRNLLEKEEDVNDLAGMLIRNNPDAGRIKNPVYLRRQIIDGLFLSFGTKDH